MLVQSEIPENLAGRVVQLFAAFIVGIYLVQVQNAVAFKYKVFVLDDGGQPLCGLDHLVHHYLSIVFCVNEIQRLSVEFESVHRAA